MDNLELEERIPLALQMMPSDIQAALDIGCGDGNILSKISPDCNKVGIDISYNALKSNLTENRALAVSNNLPFRDGQYDIVICTEVFEHLPDRVFEETIGEIERVARKYILMSVPFQEDLDSKMTRCINCGYVYHIHLHLRSFDLYRIKQLFNRFDMIEIKYSQTQELSYPAWVLKVRRNIGKRWEWNENCLCPHCGIKNNTPPRRTIVSAVTSIAGSIFGQNHPKWAIVLYRKK